MKTIVIGVIGADVHAVGNKIIEYVLKAEGYNVEWIMKYNFIAGAEVEDANRDLVEAGCKLIYNNSYDHAYEIPAVASEYPEVQFAHATGTMAHTENLPNFHNAFASIFSASLKKTYDPDEDDDDKMTERIVLLVENGQL